MKEDGLKPIDCRLAAHPFVAKLYQLGYEVKYRFDGNRPFLRIEVLRAGRLAGWCKVEIIKESSQQHADNILVYPAHRRQGLADAMMVCAEGLTGLTMVPAANQTDEGKAFWDRPNRPWGNRTD